MPTAMIDSALRPAAGSEIVRPRLRGSTKSDMVIKPMMAKPTMFNCACASGVTKYPEGAASSNHSSTGSRIGSPPGWCPLEVQLR